MIDSAGVGRAMTLFEMERDSKIANLQSRFNKGEITLQIEVDSISIIQRDYAKKISDAKRLLKLREFRVEGRPDLGDLTYVT